MEMQEVPIGLAMALAQNFNAMTAFSGMAPAQRQRVIDSAHGVNSKDEMQNLVQSIERGF